MKSDGSLARCSREGRICDAIFAVVCACGHNIRVIPPQNIEHAVQISSVILRWSGLSPSLGRQALPMSCHSASDKFPRSPWRQQDTGAATNTKAR
ncbi:protein of unknown function (plasmid) [Shinella sp. WSC3-e]|nr:hypothetical protein SHINE37_100230 [Rhizobiaceae bacterium]CAK7261780.1 protein of unknown function [Shinella sp. WSC3-e]